MLLPCITSSGEGGWKPPWALSRRAKLTCFCMVPTGKGFLHQGNENQALGSQQDPSPPSFLCSREDGHIRCFKPISVYLFRYLTAQILSLCSSLENSKCGTRGAARDCKVSAVPWVLSVRTLLCYLPCWSTGVSIDLGWPGNAGLLEAVFPL